ncbi:hypothetical protein Tco_0258246, partial [Tanacetum coccineum]
PGGSSSFRGPPAYYSYRGYAPQAPTGGAIPISHGLVHPSGVLHNSYPLDAQHMYPLSNALAYPSLAPNSLFADYSGCATPFVHWIGYYPLPNGLKMPSHVGSYDEKGDPDNFLHLFDGAIQDRKHSQLRGLEGKVSVSI